MKPSECGRTWELEALRDGRLGDASRARVEAHVTGCTGCQDVAESLARIAESVAGAGHGLDELALRRLRTKVLRDADARVRRSAGPHTARMRRIWGAVGMVAVAGTVAAALMLSRGERSPARTERLPPAHAAVIIEPSQGTVWSRNLTRGVDRIVLVRGIVRLRVDRHRGDATVRVVTPDATVEDIGTVFAVDVQDGRTRAVRVEEGRVSITFTDGRRVDLGAGEAWQASTNARADATALQPATVRGDTAGTPTGAPNATSVHRSDDARQLAIDEDGDYLAVVAAARAGDVDGADRAARRYLARHPDGFRRREVEALLAH